MPLQNRVNPFGELIATPARGTLMGNRGCLHDGHRRIRRPFALRRWILCVLQFRGRHRTVMSPGKYTELFFLDEATGLAAGHRPCFECQRQRYHLFRDTWVAANPDLAGSATPTADQIDAVLHAERLDGHRQKRTHPAELADLPAGVMVLLEGDDRPWLVLADELRPWSADGYGEAIPRPANAGVRLLSPPSVAWAIAKGFPVSFSGAGESGRG
jgi:hypothetical protein